MPILVNCCPPVDVVCPSPVSPLSVTRFWNCIVVTAALAVGVIVSSSRFGFRSAALDVELHVTRLHQREPQSSASVSFDSFAESGAVAVARPVPANRASSIACVALHRHCPALDFRVGAIDVRCVGACSRVVQGPVAPVHVA